ncbi:MAG: right-handed parallel beta-helix repeat-containing protein [Planctomycetes bacterium]|nr:right-handed parallel beta-helix repeat-containing protein [Planctomycetota bacterium]
MRIESFVLAAALSEIFVLAGSPRESPGPSNAPEIPQDPEEEASRRRREAERMEAEARRRADAEMELRELQGKLQALPADSDARPGIEARIAEIEAMLAAPPAGASPGGKDPGAIWKEGALEVRWEGEISLREKLIVPAGKILSVRPGTRVRLFGGWDSSIEVRGALFARGTKEEPIRFTPEGVGYWGGILFAGDASRGVMEHCVVTNGRHAAIACRESSPVIRDCRIEDSVYFGIDGGIVCEGGRPVIERNRIACTVERNYPRAAVLLLGSGATVRDNAISNYTVGIQIAGTSDARPRVEGNRLEKGRLPVLDEALRPTLILTRRLVSEDVKFVTSMKAAQADGGKVVDLATWSGTYRCRHSAGSGIRLEMTSDVSNPDRCEMGETRGLVTEAGVKLGEGRDYRAICVPTVLSQLGRAGCEDTPEDILVLYAEKEGRRTVVWTSDHPGRGKFHVVAVDLTGDGADEIVIAQNGWCDQMGRVRVYGLAPAAAE